MGRGGKTGMAVTWVLLKRVKEWLFLYLTAHQSICSLKLNHLCPKHLSGICYSLRNRGWNKIYRIATTTGRWQKQPLALPFQYTMYIWFCSIVKSRYIFIYPIYAYTLCISYVFHIFHLNRMKFNRGRPLSVFFSWMSSSSCDYAPS